MSISPIHKLRVPEVYRYLETSPHGLTTDESQARRSLYGSNILSIQRREPIWHKYIQQFRHPFVILMLLAGIISLLQKDTTLAFVIWSLALVNGGFSFWREYRAEQAVDKLRHLLPSYAHLMRDEKEVHIPADEVVPGDILILAEGDNIPADARVVEEYGLRVNNAALTGEAVPARRTADASFLTGISDLEQPNLVYAGTSVASGTGKAVVYAIGMLSQFGRIAHLTTTVQEEPSQFQRELVRLSRVITVIAICVGVLIWSFATFEPTIRQYIPNPLLLALGLIVAITPEGLLATLTLSLAIAVQRLSSRGVLAKRLSILETLGNVSVICTDKSGTLTQNQMTVREIWISQKKLKITGVGYEPIGEFLPSLDNPTSIQDLTLFLKAALGCNNARLNPPTPESPTWTSLGDQTEAALKVAAIKFGLDEKYVQSVYRRIHEIPFDAKRKRMSTIHRVQSSEIAFIKGAPREILQLCTHIQINGEAIPLDEEKRREIISTNDDYARRALRVLSIAYRELPQHFGPYTADAVECNLIFLGLAAMMDPPRPEVEQAVQICQQAKIRIVMITGDYGLTAESLARRVGMISSHNPLIITGAELEKMSDAAILQSLDKEVLFARMAPDHKLRLVSIFQSRGDVIAVTGDGVNDAPALRKADVGIAMGVIGTDVAKEAADIILTNDNFGAIVAAIEEGRAIYDNIRKFISYIFSSNVPEILPFLVTASFGIPPALTVRQILAIDMGTDLVPALALGQERPEPDVMLQPPRHRAQPLLDGRLLCRAFLWLGTIEAMLCFIGFFSVYVFSGNVDKLNLPWLMQIKAPILFNIDNIHLMAQTVFHVGVVTAQVGNAFACRTSKERFFQTGWGINRILLFGIGIELIIILGLIYIPSLANAFNHVALPLISWPILMLYPLLLYTLEWTRKNIVRWFKITRESRATNSYN